MHGYAPTKSQIPQFYLLVACLFCVHRTSSMSYGINHNDGWSTMMKIVKIELGSKFYLATGAIRNRNNNNNDFIDIHMESVDHIYFIIIIS